MPDTEQKSVGDVAGELWELTKGYAKQETVDPLKGVGRYLAFGVGGALALGLGVVFLALAGLRALQDHTSLGTGSLSWAPYVIVLLVAAGLAALALSRINRRS